MTGLQKLPFNCPYSSRMVASPPTSEDDSQQTAAGAGFSPGPCPPAKTSAEHRNEVLATAGRLYNKRAKYNREFDNIVRTRNDNIAEQTAMDEEQERINKAIEALEKRKRTHENAVVALKDREEVAKKQLDKIEDGIAKLNAEIKYAFLD
jgi:hypothetical protein